MRAAIPPYLRSLWNLTAPVHDIAPSGQCQPFLSASGMHLPLLAPVGSDARWFEAAAAHAAAHLVFSTHRFDPVRLGPIPQAVLGVLEDARVEWLACRELPGLRRLWLPFHATVHSDTPGFEELLGRLARSLLDPDWIDPHPWIDKARRMFYLDHSGDMLALSQAPRLLHAATLLGNDIGQMRLQFNARLYRVAPCYRDDNAHLWSADPARADVTHDLSGNGSGGSSNAGRSATSAKQAALETTAIVRYPEWDRLIGGYRRDWCTVLDTSVPATAEMDTGDPHTQAARTIVLPRRRVRLSRQLEGDAFDLDALVATRISRRRCQTPDLHVYSRLQSVPSPGATLILIDASASSAQAFQGTDASILSAARTAALRYALAIDRAGGACAIHSFCSDGRHAVRYQRIKDFAEPMDGAAVARLLSVPSRFSTRLGAALRHAVYLVGLLGGASRRVLLLTDGQPRDIDIHDDNYLIEDARHAVQDAARRNVLVQCVALDCSVQASLGRIFGDGQVAQLGNLAALPRALTTLSDCITRE